ncbi:MAG: hypothetical protein M2R45_03357 [Verrucomicrobia subdivision 3 bacterium]|nr:hypothetical protein [Limisphaerales bacterium]MCS1416730.1 hypothetical protein [Limisphaerales bacterium]
MPTASRAPETVSCPKTDTPERPDKASSVVTLPSIDASPEEIAKLCSD